MRVSVYGAFFRPFDQFPRPVAADRAGDRQVGGDELMIKALGSCQSDRERAAWLLSCPLAVLLYGQRTIRSRLLSAGFGEGVAYLEIELCRLSEPRRQDGSHFQNTELTAARGRMQRIVLGLAPR